MANMQNFVLWFVSQLPQFFLSEPMIYVFGFVVLAFVVSLVFKITGIR